MEREARRAIQEDMRRLADGDRRAFDPLFAALWPVVRSFCRRATGNQAEGDDAAQEALVKVFARASTFDPERDAVTWVLAIAAWECRTTRKRIARRREGGLVEASATESTEPADRDLESRQLAEAAGEILGSLASQDIETILAAITGDPSDRPAVPPATFRKRLERALTRLRAAWRARHGTL
jgi:RNA polymerase sigma factor (sigma-70 family)